MRCRIRNLFRSRTGSVGHKDEMVEVEGNRVRLGRGTENDVYLADLRVNYRHAEIVVRETDVIIEAIGESIVTIDGVPADRGVMTPGTEVGVGPYRVQLQDDPGADLTLEIELVAPVPTTSVERLLDPKRTTLSGGRRAMSWVFFLVVAVGALAAPVLAHLLFKPDTTAVVERQGAGPPRSVLASLDRIWITGDLSSSHKSLERRCEACHQRAFVMVRNEACGTCHDRVEHHFDMAEFTFQGLQGDDCTGCHDEHQGAKGVVPSRQALCAGCHADMDQAHETTLLDVADFGTAHPEFRPSVLVDPQAGTTRRVSLDAPDFPKEVSNLRFPHDVHLADACVPPTADTPPEQAELARQRCTIVRMAAQRLDKRGGLGCGDCHVPEPGGVNMLPVRMDDHCADCHRLEFDRDAPNRQLPHGQPDEVIAVIEDYYAAKALRAGAPEAVEVVQQAQALRRRPGGESAGAAPAPVVTQTPEPDPVAEARFVSDQKLADVFGRSLCGVCHETVPPDASASGAWEVRPVDVTALWMPKARFDHSAHKTVPCADCHAAENSPTSADVLMPGIEGCRDCHQGERARTALPSTCILCHVYHRDDLPPIMPKRELQATAGG